jgi:glutamyl-tRNA synthetase
MTENILGMGDVGPILRIGITGTMQGPPIYEMMELLGKENVINRMKIAFEKFNSLV